MNKLSILAVMALFMAPTLVASDQAAKQATIASVAGTVWAGTDLGDKDYEYHFKEDGSLHYKTPTGFWKNGNWRQNGTEIYMETNKKYAEREGKITGTSMKGKGWNVRGKKWTWQAKKK